MWTVELFVAPWGEWSNGLDIYQGNHPDNYIVLQVFIDDDWENYTPGLRPQEALTMQEKLRVRFPDVKFRAKDSGIDLKCWYVAETYAFDRPSVRSECFLDYGLALQAKAVLEGEPIPEVNFKRSLVLPDVTASTSESSTAPTEPEIIYVESSPDLRLLVVPDSLYQDGLWAPTAGDYSYITPTEAGDLSLGAIEVLFADGVE